MQTFFILLVVVFIVANGSRARSHRRCNCDWRKSQYDLYYRLTYGSPLKAAASSQDKRSLPDLDEPPLFSDCDKREWPSTSEEVIRIKSLDFHPMPIRAPGALYSSIQFDVRRALKGNLHMNVKLTKHMLNDDYEIPCIKNYLGSCNYSNICRAFGNLEDDSKDCPMEVKRSGLSCNCSIKPGTYTVRDLGIRIPRFVTPFIHLLQGKYKATIRLKEGDGENKKQIACFKVNLSLEENQRSRLLRL